MEMKKLTFLFLPVVLTFVVCAQAEKTGTTSGDYPQAPEFTLEDINGKNIALSDYKDKVIFLNFWATWCAPCRAEIPDFIEAYREYKDDGMVIIGVSVDREGKDKVLGYADRYKINYPLVMYTSQLIRDYQPGNAIPVTIVIDPKGKIRHKQIGMVNREFLETWFSKLIKDK